MDSLYELRRRILGLPADALMALTDPKYDGAITPGTNADVLRHIPQEASRILGGIGTGAMDALVPEDASMLPAAESRLLQRGGGALKTWLNRDTSAGAAPAAPLARPGAGQPPGTAPPQSPSPAQQGGQTWGTDHGGGNNALKAPESGPSNDQTPPTDAVRPPWEVFGDGSAAQPFTNANLRALPEGVERAASSYAPGAGTAEIDGAEYAGLRAGAFRMPSASDLDTITANAANSGRWDYDNAHPERNSPDASVVLRERVYKPEADDLKREADRIRANVDMAKNRILTDDPWAEDVAKAHAEAYPRVAEQEARGAADTASRTAQAQAEGTAKTETAKATLHERLAKAQEITAQSTEALAALEAKKDLSPEAKKEKEDAVRAARKTALAALNIKDDEI